MSAPLAFAAALACAAPVAVDGDTLRCANLAAPVRLLGIDAPELPGHCRRGRACAPGNPYAAWDELAAALRGAVVTVQPVAHDRYGRIVAQVFAGGRDLSCHQLARRRAVYVPRWDNGHRVAMACPAHANAAGGGR